MQGGVGWGGGVGWKVEEDGRKGRVEDGGGEEGLGGRWRRMGGRVGWKMEEGRKG